MESKFISDGAQRVAGVRTQTDTQRGQRPRGHGDRARTAAGGITKVDVGCGTAEDARTVERGVRANAIDFLLDRRELSIQGGPLSIGDRASS